MENQDESEHETARLVLMCADGESTTLTEFAKGLRNEHPDMSVARVMQLYRAYCGTNSRERPYLSIETGKRL